MSRALATLLAALVLAVPAMGLDAIDDGREAVRERLAETDATSERRARRLERRIAHAFREARGGRGDLLRALLAQDGDPESQRLFLDGPSPASVEAACARALEWTADPHAAAELLSRLFDVTLDEGRAIFAAFAPRDADGSLLPPGAPHDAER